MSKLWRDYSLSIVLFLLFMASWVGQTIMGWIQFAGEQEAHDQTARVFGSEGYFWAWGQATLENWQSEFLQLFTFVVLTAYLVHKGSHESKDTDDQMQAALNRIERRLDELSSGRDAGGRGREPDRASPASTSSR